MDHFQKPYFKKPKPRVEYSENKMKGTLQMHQAKNEFSRIADVSRIPTTSMVMDITANASECKALAERFGIPSVDGLTAKVVLKSLGGGRIRVSGELAARVKRISVVSLEEFEEEVKDSFSVLYEPEGAEISLRTNEIDLDATEEEEKEIIEDGKIDVGELVAEYLSLGLDPFPRRSGEEFMPYGETETRENPFSVLEKLKKD